MKEKESIVKARMHHGTNSMDLTIPSNIVKNLNIKEGDLFKISTTTGDNKIILEYERIYSSK
jgi:antitoxin component of MazEF toxin-antitoxin module